MNDSKKEQPIGGISELASKYKSFGQKSKKQNELTAKEQDGMQSKEQEVKTASSLEGLQLKGDEVKNFEVQNVKMGKEQEGETSKEVAVKKAKIPPNMKQQTIYLPRHLAHRLKIHAAITEQDMSDIMTKALEEYLARQEGR